MGNYREHTSIRFRGVYAITNMLTGERYIGMSRDIVGRFKTHLRDLRSGQCRIAALRKSFEIHGESAFTFSVIEFVDDWRGECGTRERYWINRLRPSFNTAKLERLVA